MSTGSSETEQDAIDDGENAHAKCRREPERNVPQHVHLAHTKAHSIIEWFLILLTAEVEKMMLFAQLRLGELANTAESYRFPFCDDSEVGPFLISLVHEDLVQPLSDGDMHPYSASSLDKENGTGVLPWSDSSDDEKKAKPVEPALLLLLGERDTGQQT